MPAPIGRTALLTHIGGDWGTLAGTLHLSPTPLNANKWMAQSCCLVSGSLQALAPELPKGAARLQTSLETFFELHLVIDHCLFYLLALLNRRLSESHKKHIVNHRPSILLPINPIKKRDMRSVAKQVGRPFRLLR